MKETVKVELLKDPECLMGFSCGEPSIDELIKKAYYETLLEKRIYVCCYFGIIA